MRSKKADKIIELICTHFGVSETELTGKGKTYDVTRPRQCAYVLLCKYDTKCKSSVGRILGRTYYGVLRGLKAAQDAVDTKTHIYEDLQILEEQYKAWKRQSHPFYAQNAKLPNFTMKALLEQKVNKHLTAA